MSGGDSLLEIIELARAAMPEVPAEAWERFEAAIRRQMGGERHYIAARRKRYHLQAVSRGVEAGSTAEDLADELGLSPRRIRQIQKLCRR